MDNIRNKYFKIIELYKDNDEMAINKMIDLFQEVADSYEHDIYDSIIQWIGLKGGEKTINYIEHLNTKLYDTLFLLPSWPQCYVDQIHSYCCYMYQ